MFGDATQVSTPLTYANLKRLFDQWFRESEQARRDEAMRWVSFAVRAQRWGKP